MSFIVVQMLPTVVFFMGNIQIKPQSKWMTLKSKFLRYFMSGIQSAMMVYSMYFAGMNDF